ncbi:hypothetical protein [Enterobacter kobei]|uniref:hypothetical protein n=1 Tax=Enterobacter kobei TaxID=208224 RepID=UPI00069AD965|nr:hypothetical protein [Enterobacter kobei]
MSTITREFTKEQLIEHIELRLAHTQQADRGGVIGELYEKETVVLEIALAAMNAPDQEPVADVVFWSSPNEERTCDIRWRRHDVSPGPLYTAPPAPVVPNGWVLVPVEPTEDMIVNGFESEPVESFSDEKEWEAYDAMSGCQQAAHRAKLCYAAMITAAPKP